MATYLLPCSCGRDIEVGAGQAGRTVRCECGLEHDVPSIRGLERLRQKSVEITTHSWGWRQAVLFVGLLLLVLGSAVGTYYQLKRPTVDDYDAIRADVEKWTPEQQRFYWNYMRLYGVAAITRDEMELLQADRHNSTLSKIGFLVASSGLVLTAATLLVPKGRAACTAQATVAGSGGKPS